MLGGTILSAKQFWEEEWQENVRMSRRLLYKLADELRVTPDRFWTGKFVLNTLRVDVIRIRMNGA